MNIQRLNEIKTELDNFYNKNPSDEAAAACDAMGDLVGAIEAATPDDESVHEGEYQVEKLMHQWRSV